jgi:hypothetical protein
MKKYVLMGVIALVMLVFAAPVMAADAATVSVSGGITQTLAISTDTTSVGFGQFTLGDNRVDSGTLTVTSAFVPHWTVTAATSDGYGYMRTGSGAPVTGTYLASKLQEYNWLAVTPAWQDVQGLSFTGSASTSMIQTYMQNVLVSDTPGTYGTTVTYTIAAV